MVKRMDEIDVRLDTLEEEIDRAERIWSTIESYHAQNMSGFSGDLYYPVWLRGAVRGTGGSDRRVLPALAPVLAPGMICLLQVLLSLTSYNQTQSRLHGSKGSPDLQGLVCRKAAPPK